MAQIQKFGLLQICGLFSVHGVINISKKLKNSFNWITVTLTSNFLYDHAVEVKKKKRFLLVCNALTNSNRSTG